MGVYVDIDVDLSCDKCGKSLTDGDDIFCKECASGLSYGVAIGPLCIPYRDGDSVYCANSHRTYTWPNVSSGFTRCPCCGLIVKE